MHWRDRKVRVTEGLLIPAPSLESFQFLGILVPEGLEGLDGLALGDVGLEDPGDENPVGLVVESDLSGL